MPSVQLTYDTWELITDILGDALDSDHPSASMLALRNLALTCKAMVPLCRRHLFSTLNLTSFAGDSANRLTTLIGRFHELISNLEIIHHIRHLRHHIRLPEDVRVHEIFDVLCSSTSLRSIDLWGARKDWNTFPRVFQILLERLIHQPTITKLKISSMKSIPSSLLLGSTSVTHLTLEDVRITRNNDSDVDTVSRVASTLRPTYLSATYDSYESLWVLMHPSGSTQDQRIIDLSGLQKGVFWSVENARDMEVVHQVLYSSKELESLDISTRMPLSWTGLGASLSVSHVRTLRSLTLGPHVISKEEDPLRDLVSELRIIAETNILEEVSLDLTFDDETAYRTDTGDWSAFDTLLTRPGLFPMLKNVAIDILWVLWGGDEKEIEARITKQSFPNLSESTTVEFEVSSSFHWM